MTDDEIKALREKAQQATEGPWFTAADDAEDAPVHTDAGLSLVETGRSNDGPIARLIEGQNAAYIAAVDPQTVLGLLDQHAALMRAARIIDWTASYIGRMAPPEGGIADLNEHWLYMETIGVPPGGETWRGPKGPDERPLDQKRTKPR